MSTVSGGMVVGHRNGNGGQPPQRSGLARFVRPAPPPDASPEVLARFEASQRPKPKPGEACEMCATPIPEEHGHVVNVESRELMCVCRPCYLLFAKEGAAQGKYRQVPERYLFDPYFSLDAAQWEQIQIPVSMAFFFYNSSLERFVAFYPSPAGATESLLDLDAWREVMSANVSFEGILPDTEALLMRKDSKRRVPVPAERSEAVEEGRFECYLVPIDKAYELTAIVRMHWKGFGGGEEVWDRIDAFFESMRARSAVVGIGPRKPGDQPAGG